MTWPVFAVGDKVDGASFANAKNYVDQTVGTSAKTADLLARRDSNGNADVGIDLETFGRFQVATASLTSATVSDRTLTASAAPGISNDPIYSLSSGQLVIGAPGVYIVNVLATFNGTNTRKFVDLVAVSGVDATSRIPYTGTEDAFGGTVMMTVNGSSGTIKLQAYQEASATSFTAVLRIQRLARLT